MSNLSDFIIENGVLTKYVGPGGDVVIPHGVTSIGDKAFYGCSSLTNVTIPEGVTSIGLFAFKGCSGLTSVTIPEGVTSIGDYAFLGCSGLTSVTIPDSVMSIDDNVFKGCSGLADKNGFVIIRGVLRHYCGPGKDVTIPEGVTAIEHGAFAGCKGLTSVAIPESVTSIGELAFNGCDSLKSVEIPDSVTNIGETAFPWQTLILINDVYRLSPLFRINAAISFAKGGGGKRSPGFDSHSKYIKSNAAKLVKDAMEEPALLSLMCREKLITPKNVELYVNAAQKTGNAELIAMMLDYKANKISTKQKENWEKRKEKERDTIIDRTVARQDKEGIEGLNIAVTGDLKTFKNRNEINAFILEKGGKMASSISAKVDYLIMNDLNPNSTKMKKAKELGIEIIDEYRFNFLAGRFFALDGEKLIRYCGTDTDVNIPDGVTSIGKDAFSGCKTMASVTIPEGVTEIGDWAFSHCSCMTQVSIPGSVTSIGKCAFCGCSSLTSVTIPEKVTVIGGWVFRDCSNLTSVTIPANVTDIGYNAFYNSPNLTIHAPAGSYAERYAKANNIPFVAE